MLFLKVLGQQCVGLQQALPRQGDVLPAKGQIAFGHLSGQRFGELFQNVHTKLAAERCGRDMAFLDLQNEFSNQSLAIGRPECTIDRQYPGFQCAEVVLQLIDVLIVNSLEMAK